MAYNDTLSDFFARLRNAYSSKLLKVSVRNTKFTLVVLDFLYKEGYIRGYFCVDFRTVIVFLKYVKNEPVFREIRQISTPGNKIFFNLRQANRLIGNRKWLSSRYIVSTSSGLKTLDQCFVLRLGGLLLFKIL